jgi:hypothetical protein
MAQRAYRQRKETTLDDLRKRVSELTTAAECMNKAFENCRDRIIMAGLSEGQLEDLAETTLRFAGYMSNVRNPGDSQDEVTPEATIPAPILKDNSITVRHTEDTSLVPKNVPSWLDKATLGQTGRQAQQPDVGMGYTLYTPGVFDQHVETFNIPTMPHGMHPRSPVMPDIISLEPNNAPQMPQRSLSASGELPPPKTYSFHETTLARRLHRACLEAAYHLLLDPVRKPHTYERVFKLSLLSRDRTRMASSLKKILDRGLDDPLDFWDAPLLHIGGAGTHYPLRGRPSVAQDPRPKFHLGTIGPQILNLLDNVVQARPSAEISVEIEGFEGTWFDPYDVEGYLESKGVHIDPTVSFVEAEIADFPAESSTVSSGSSGHTSSVPQSSKTSPLLDPEQWSEMQRLEADMVRWQDMENVQLSGLGNVGFSDADTGSWMNFQAVEQTQQQKAPAMGNTLGFGMDGFGSPTPMYEAPVTPQQKKVVIIDVAKFIKGRRNLSAMLFGKEADCPPVLTVTGICLGRTPGFKRKDVDRALAISSFDAF